MNRPLDYILLYVKGLCMGAVDIIPGVSGGTIAFTTGIHRELVRSLRAIDREAFELIYHRRFRDCWNKINGPFLVTVLGGVASSFLVMATLVLHWVGRYPIVVWSFLFGVTLMVAPLMLRAIHKWSVGVVLAFLVGLATTYLLADAPLLRTPHTLWMAFIAGIIGIGGMLIPGVSGGFWLVLIGKYQYMINNLARFNVLVLAMFFTGCVVGLLGFARFLTGALDNYHNTTVALLSGFALGSLNKLWPWREVLEYVTNAKGEQVAVHGKSVLPWHYFATTGKDPQVFQAIFMMALGVIIVILIEKITTRLKTKF